MGSTVLDGFNRSLFRSAFARLFLDRRPAGSTKKTRPCFLELRARVVEGGSRNVGAFARMTAWIEVDQPERSSSNRMPTRFGIVPTRKSP
jgi:hypothetical protein